MNRKKPIWAKKARKSRKVQVPLPLSKLMKKADILFSQKRRLEEAIDEYCFCITCGVRKHWKDIDNGHFINRGYAATRYEKNNNWPQCKKCNRFRQGDHSKFRDELIRLVGIEEVERLEKKKYENVIFLRSLYEDVIEDCKTWLKNKGI